MDTTTNETPQANAEQSETAAAWRIEEDDTNWCVWWAEYGEGLE